MMALDTAGRLDPKYYRDLIGIPFEYSGRGPDGYDCYGLLMEIFNRRGIIIPDYKSSKNHVINYQSIVDGIHKWIEVDPFPGCGLLFKQKGLASHVGVLVSADTFIHAHNLIGQVKLERFETWSHDYLGSYEFALNG